MARAKGRDVQQRGRWLRIGLLAWVVISLVWLISIQRSATPASHAPAFDGNSVKLTGIALSDEDTGWAVGTQTLGSNQSKALILHMQQGHWQRLSSF